MTAFIHHGPPPAQEVTQARTPEMTFLTHPEPPLPDHVSRMSLKLLGKHGEMTVAHARIGMNLVLILPCVASVVAVHHTGLFSATLRTERMGWEYRTSAWVPRVRTLLICKTSAAVTQ